MEREQFTFYRSYYEAIAGLPKKDQGPVLMAICAYALNEDEPTLTGTQAVVFSLIRPTLDSGRKKAKNRLNKLKEQAETDEEQKKNKRKTNVKQNGKEKEREKEGEVEREVEKENDSYIYIPPKPPLQVAMDDFAKFRKAMKKPLTDKARELTLAELEKLAPGDEQKQIAILNQSIQRGWQGVFPLKEEQKPEPQRTKNGMPVKVGRLEGGDDLERLARMMNVGNGS